MDPNVIILSKLIERLGAMGIDGSKPGKRSAWEGTPQADELRERGLRGQGHLEQALGMARQALASGDTDQIATAALYAPTLERQGRELKQKKVEADAQAVVASRRKTGGKMRGKAQTETAAARWAPYVNRCKELVSAGKSLREARSIVKGIMTKDGFTVSPDNEFPSGPTIGKWLTGK